MEQPQRERSWLWGYRGPGCATGDLHWKSHRYQVPRHSQILFSSSIITELSGKQEESLTTTTPQETCREVQLSSGCRPWQ